MEVARDQLRATTAHLHSGGIKEQMRGVYCILEISLDPMPLQLNLFTTLV
jgi:hypothetical protein